MKSALVRELQRQAREEMRMQRRLEEEVRRHPEQETEDDEAALPPDRPASPPHSGPTYRYPPDKEAAYQKYAAENRDRAISRVEWWERVSEALQRYEQQKKEDEG